MTVTIGLLLFLASAISYIVSQNLTHIAISLDTARTIIEYNGIQELYNMIVPIGLSICVLYFLLEMVEQTTHDNFTVEHLIRGFLKLILGVMLITNLMDIFYIFLDISSAISEYFCDLFSAGYNSSTLVKPNFTGASFFTAMGDFSTYFVNSIPLLLVILSLYFVSISRNITLAIYAIFSPIGVSNLFSRGLDSNGMSYLKRFLAICLQGAIIAGITAIYTVLITDSGWFTVSAVSGETENVANFLTEFLAGFAVCSMLFKSKQISETIVGVK